jgi:hypothetical protein
MQWAEKYGEKKKYAIGAHHDEIEFTITNNSSL